MSRFYAVKIGRQPGIYRSWNDCYKQVNKYSNALYKKFKTQKDAEEWLSDIKDFIIKKEEKLSNSDPFKNLYPSPKKRVNSMIDRKFYKKMRYERIVIYTDGACKKNGSQFECGGIGIYFDDLDPRNVSEKITGNNITNQRMEMTAAIRALQICFINKYFYIEIRTDSMYLINGIKYWITNWKQNNWTSAKGKSIKNIDLWKQLDELNNKLDVQWTYVQGHNGTHGNEMADYYANICLQ